MGLDPFGFTSGMYSSWIFDYLSVLTEHTNPQVYEMLTSHFTTVDEYTGYGLNPILYIVSCTCVGICPERVPPE